MKISAIAPWYGSKRTLAPQIVQQLGPHSCYWEPFCGSMAVLMAKEPATYETVNDLHGDLVNLARVLQDEKLAKKLYARAYRTLCCETFARDAKQLLHRRMPQRLPSVDRAYHYLVHAWFHVNGIAGTPLRHTGTFCVRYSAKGGNGATRWRSVVDSIPDWHERLLKVQILSRDAFALLPRIDDDPDTALYVDPPYVKKGSKYVHDFQAGEHASLAALLRRFRQSRIVISYYADPLLDELYPGWTKLDQTRLRVAKLMVNSGRRDQGGRVEAPEVLLINGPAVEEPEHYGELFREVEA